MLSFSRYLNLQGQGPTEGTRGQEEGRGAREEPAQEVSKKSTIERIESVWNGFILSESFH